jgi:hypothetical protein
LIRNPFDRIGRAQATLQLRRRIADYGQASTEQCDPARAARAILPRPVADR